MHISSHLRRVSRVFRAPITSHFHRFQSPDLQKEVTPLQQWQHTRGFSPDPTLGTYNSFNSTFQQVGRGHDCQLTCSRIGRACFSSQMEKVCESPTEAVNEVYLKMLKSVEAETMPPNAWMWSLIDSCANREDIKLLFQMLQNLRRFRLSNLRIHENFNSHLCQKVAEACTRVGALDFGKKALWKHNVYGLTPTVASAHHLLLFAKEHNDVKLMVAIIKLLKNNGLPLQPGTADIVFSICSNTDNWGFISKYSKKFIKEGVKLRRTSFGTWMEFAAKRGDVESLWKIEELRLKTVKQHNIATGISCAKGYLLEHKPESAASVIYGLNQNLPDKKRPEIMIELQKLVTEWSSEVIKRQKEEDRKTLASSLRSDIPAMVEILLNEGLQMMMNVEDRIKEAIPL